MSAIPKEIKIDTDIAFRALPVIRDLLNDQFTHGGLLNETEVEILTELADLLLAKKCAVVDRYSYSEKLGVK